MRVKVKLPAPIARYTDDKTIVDAQGSTIREIIDDLDRRYPGLKNKFLDKTGKPHRFVRIHVNKIDIRELNGLDTKLEEGDEVALIPAFVGG